MWFFKKKLKPEEVLNEAERILKEPKGKSSKKGIPECPKCHSTKVTKIIGWKESASGYSTFEKWRGQDLRPYRCRDCGYEFYA